MKFWRRRKDEELDAEIRSHLDEAIRDRMARGEAPDEARANALREFGNVGLVKEVTREMWGRAWLTSDSIEELSLKAARSSNSIAGLTSVSNCASLKKLTLDLSGSQVSNLEPLAKLSNLTQLTLDLSGSQVSNLEPLAKLPKVQKLSLPFATRAQRMSLQKLPASVVELSF